MSLIALFKDELVADKRGIMGRPHAVGLTRVVTKIYVNDDKTIAFGSVGPTLTQDEQKVLCKIFEMSFKAMGSEPDFINIDAGGFMDSRTGLNVLLMTKKSSYYMEVEAISDDSPDRRLIRFDPTYAAVYGSGYMAAGVALNEGIAMKDLCPIVSDVIYSVSPEYDLFHRKNLKGMKL